MLPRLVLLLLLSKPHLAMPNESSMNAPHHRKPIIRTLRFRTVECTSPCSNVNECASVARMLRENREKKIDIRIKNRREAKRSTPTTSANVKYKHKNLLHICSLGAQNICSKVRRIVVTFSNFFLNLIFSFRDCFPFIFIHFFFGLTEQREWNKK